MAEASNTLAGLIQMNDNNLADIEVSDLLQSATVLAALAAVEASNDTLHKYLKETVAPGAAFRDVNTGRANAAGQEELVTETLKILDASFERDKAVALGFKGGPDAYMAREAVKSIRAAFFTAEQQIINGTGSDSDGFTGMANAVDALTDALMTNAGGTTADTASSVYLLRSTETDVAVVAGQDGNLDISEAVDAVVNTDAADATQRMSALAVSILGWLGLQIGSVFSIGRICNITADTGKGVTDDLIFTAISAFPSDRQPTHIIMNRRSIEQLRKSRTATNATGAPAPTPTEVGGIPIVLTDAITNTEALIA